jgi:hypothetical protein
MKQLIMEMKRKFERVPLTEKDWDGDGKQETPEQEYMGVKDRAIKKAINADDDRPECDSCSGGGCEDCKNTGMKPEYQNEMSTTAGVAPVTTPYAFSKDKKQKKKMKYPGVAEAMEKRYERLIEGYRTYATSDPKKSPESKVNETIIEVSKKLREIEESVKNASRLKEESGVTREGYKKRTNKALDAISERLVKISERVRNLMQ